MVPQLYWSYLIFLHWVLSIWKFVYFIFYILCVSVIANNNVEMVEFLILLCGFFFLIFQSNTFTCAQQFPRITHNFKTYLTFYIYNNIKNMCLEMIKRNNGKQNVHIYEKRIHLCTDFPSVHKMITSFLHRMSYYFTSWRKRFS